MLIVFLPSMPSKIEEKKHEKIKGDAGWYRKLIPLSLQIFLVASCYYVIVYMISVYVGDAGIGNAAFSGGLSSIGTVASCVACMLFGVVYAKLKEATPLPSFFILVYPFSLWVFFPMQPLL